jgi:hypothetical protein
MAQAAEEPASAYDWFITADTDSFFRLAGIVRRVQHMRPNLDPRTQPVFWGHMLWATAHWRAGTGVTGGRPVDADYQAEGYNYAIGMLYLMSYVRPGRIYALWAPADSRAAQVRAHSQARRDRERPPARGLVPVRRHARRLVGAGARARHGRRRGPRRLPQPAPPRRHERVEGRARRLGLGRRPPREHGGDGRAPRTPRVGGRVGRAAAAQGGRVSARGRECAVGGTCWMYCDDTAILTYHTFAWGLSATLAQPPTRADMPVDHDAHRDSWHVSYRPKHSVLPLAQQYHDCRQLYLLQQPKAQ